MSNAAVVIGGVGANRVNIKQFGAKGDGVSNDLPAYNAILAAFPTGPIVIDFPAGHYVNTSSTIPWIFGGPSLGASNNYGGRSDVTLIGEGREQTILDSFIFQLAGVRAIGWNHLSASTMAQFQDASPGQDFLTLVVIADASKFSPGNVVFIRSGAVNLDVDYGEFNVVRSVDAVNGIVYFESNTLRDYSLATSPSTQTLNGTFTIPAVGATANLVVNEANSFNGSSPIAIATLTVGRNLFSITAFISGTTVTVKNDGAGNQAPNTVLSSGTAVTKGRGIFTTPFTPQNQRFERLQFTNSSSAPGTTVNFWSLSNSIRAQFVDCSLNVISPTLNQGSLFLEGDDGRDAKFERCLFKNLQPGPPTAVVDTQIARAYAGLNFIDSEFHQIRMGFSEYNIACKVQGCKIFLDGYAEGTDAVFTLGTSVESILVQGNHIYAQNVHDVFGSSDIASGVCQAGFCQIENNHIVCNNVNNVFGMGAQSAKCNDNMIVGMVGSLCIAPLHNLLNANVLAIHGAQWEIANNHFAGYINGVTQQESNMWIHDNTFRRLGAATGSRCSQAILEASGTLVFNGSATADTNFRFEDNTFIGWKYQSTSWNWSAPNHPTNAIQRNHFVSTDATSGSRANSTFTVSALPDQETVLFHTTSDIASANSTSEQNLAYVFLLPGHWGPNSSCEVEMAWTFTNNANAKTIQIGLSTGGNTAVWTFNAASLANYRTRVIVANRGATNSQISFEDWGGSSSAIQTAAADTTVSGYIAIGVTKATGTDTATLNSCRIRFNPGYTHSLDAVV